MARYICVATLLVAVALSGCEEYEYDIEMTPDGAAIKRTISFSDNLPQDDRCTIEKAYSQRIDANTFSGTFKVEMPTDVGGAGYYTSFLTAMGTTATYSERFRGDDDVRGHIEKFGMFVDKYIDFSLNWLEFELGAEPNFQRLKEVLDRRARSDLRNMGLYSWLSSLVGQYDPNAGDEMEMRAIHYLEERRYISPGQAGVLMQRANRSGEEEMWQVFRDCVAREMGYRANGADSEKLAFLASSDTAAASAVRYIKSTQQYRQMWEQARIETNDPNWPAPEVDISDFVGAGELFDLGIGETKYRVKLRLRCSQRPYETNGQWQDANNQVCWSARVSGKDDLPTFFYASWSTPDRDFQASRFGRVILDGKALADYCYWEKSIEPNQVLEWNDFLNGVDPNEDIVSRIKAVRFAGESPDPNAPAAASFPRDLILNALSPR